MKSLLQKYIDKTIKEKAKIGYDKEVKRWYGILEHKVGLIYSQRGTESAVKKELAEVLEDFIILSLKEDKKDIYNGVKTHKVQAAYR